MTVSNHALVGATIATVIKQPLLALPLAFMSHFVLDAIPHFGYYGQGFGEAFKHKLTYVEIGLSTICIIILLFLLWGQSVWVYLAAFVAASPDLMSVYRYYWFERFNKQPPGGWLTRFHYRIQTYERPWGIVLEVIFFIGLLAIYLKIRA